MKTERKPPVKGNGKAAAKPVKKSSCRYGERVFAEGVSISNDTRATGLNNNDLICGKSGCGKTGGYVIPNIQQIDGSMVVSDTKGQLARRFRGELESKGYHVHTIDLVDMTRSCGYNPLDFIRRHEDGSYYGQDVLALAKLLCPQQDQKEPIWDQCTQMYLSFLIAYCLETEDPEDQNLITVAELHRIYSGRDGSIPFAAWVNEHPKSFASKKYRELETNRLAEKMWSSIMGFVNTNLAPFDFPEAEIVFASKEPFDLGLLGREKTVLFLNVSDTDRSLDAIINMIYSQILHVLCYQADKKPDGRLAVPVRIILDDFAASATIPDFDKIISVIRSRDIYVSVVIQSVSQLDSMYGDAASRTILNNCDHILFMGSQDRITADYIASRAMKTVETIYAMPIDKIYLITAGERAQLVQKITPYSTTNDY
ncbi:MAG: type IV secretory system conjugative DNA transfer family protein, partial [Lachnospiraceae bacterium]|nr:type IV secretory system conjugative DNA transfer family protein [Lachnospiraceae bacterium]